MQAAIHHAIVALRKASSVVVCAHVRPDGDAIGSSLAMTLALRDAGISAIPTLASGAPAPSTYSWLPGFGLFVPAGQLEAPDVFVALDTPVADRLGEGEALMRGATHVVTIDHHPDATPLGSVNVIDSSAPATGELVWQFAQALLDSPSPDIALCCYVGLITDTGRFSYDNTSPRAFAAAAEMLEAGVNASDAARMTYQNRSQASLAIEARAMTRLTLANGGRVAYAWVDDADFAELGALPEEAETLPDAVRLLRGIDAAVLMRQQGDEVRVNFRAKTGFDVGAVARAFGGGGHKAAAGATMSGRIADVIEQILPHLPGGDRA